MNNPIIEEVREARESLAAVFDFDLHRIVADAMARQEGQKTVNRQSKSLVREKSLKAVRESGNQS